MVEDRVTLDGHMVVCAPSQIDDRDVLHAEKALVTVVVGSYHALYIKLYQISILYLLSVSETWKSYLGNPSSI